MKINKMKKWVSNITTILLTFILVFSMYIVITSKLTGNEPQIFGFQLKTVFSGSMEPGIKTGSIILVKLSEKTDKYKANDVITFKEENQLVTHRIVEVIQSSDQVMYRTKGDHNQTEDLNPVLSTNVIAEYTGVTIPYLGYINEFAKSKNGNLLLLVLPGLILLGYSSFIIWRTISEIDVNSKEGEGKSA